MSMLTKKTQQTYLKIVAGKIAKKTNENDPNASEYTKLDGSKLYYEFFDGITGLITNISYKPAPEAHKDYPATWGITIVNNDEKAELQLSAGSYYAQAFFCILPNIDPLFTVTIEPQEKEGFWQGLPKTSRTLFIKQQGQTLKWYYTKADKKDLPEIQKIERKGKKPIYDDDERNEFFQKMAEDYNNTLKASANTIPGSYEVEAAPENVVSQDSEDLPF